MPQARHIKGKIWELRPSAERLFYAAMSGKRFIMLHGYRKKSDKTPQAEIEIAKTRWGDFLGREK
jgi:phage-related protein